MQDVIKTSNLNSADSNKTMYHYIWHMKFMIWNLNLLYSKQIAEVS